MDKRTIEQIIDLFTVNQPRARAAARSEVEAAFAHNTFEAIAKDFPTTSGDPSLALLVLCIKRAAIWWEVRE